MHTLMLFALVISLAVMGQLGSRVAVAQQSPFRLAEQVFRRADGTLNYVAPLRALQRNRHSFEPSAYAQALASYRVFVGQLVSLPAVQPPSRAVYALASPDTLLLRRARATSVVLLNEAHTQPAHRAYCHRLLKQLAPLGYTYFAVEALEPADTNITQRRFPLATSGFYTCEPTMGRLLRAAIEGGYHLVAHELSAAQEQEFIDWRRRSNFRDSMQALNLLAVLRQHPRARIVALVGHDHVLERERDGLKRLAAYLRELGGIDPLTIDQTQPAPAGTQPQSGPGPWLLTTASRQQTITTGYNTGYVDVQFVHPPFTLRQGRPNWLFTAADAVPRVVAIPQAYRTRPNLVQLFDQHEYQRYGRRAIPLDQCLTTAGQRQVTLFTTQPGRTVIISYLPAYLP